MKKYLGIIKIKIESFSGVDIQILTTFSNSKSYIKKWMDLYPDDEKIILDNNESLNNFFKNFEDITPVTEKEKANAQKLYQDLMNE